jgi:hypothetical protein
VGLAAGSLAAPALAHHSFAMFDFQQNKTLSGTVVQFDWTNPHTFLWLDCATGAGGAVEKWAIEGMSPNYLGRRGWSKTTVQPGDKITVTIHPLKDGVKGGTLLKIVLPDGKEMTNLGS